ncbi:PREDICTED: uncharacterized protein LOC106314193 [Brassica oleracea var. oleracea]|uniref:uncharacterized protein LOC106314193 n=1 Tax=Brassica oleracea var. oleracea TaxID=109376 RepID=UPI0006A6BA47|nr:PREDICTED: uncharacterized protein LOC106314193 [Brassica oleracea var. oleracea]
MGTLALTSMSSSRVFMDYDFQPTIDYFGWLSSNPAIAEHVDAEVVTKRETMTIGELFSYIKQESSKEAFFECTATIDDVVHDYAWYYISCSGCHSKVTKGPTSLICTNNKCGKVNVDGVAQYMARLSVYDNSEQAVFVLLGDAGRALTGKHASELVSNYFEQQYRMKGFATYIDLISCLLLAEANNELLMKNSEARPVGTAPLPEASGIEKKNPNECNYIQNDKRPHGRGRGGYRNRDNYSNGRDRYMAGRKGNHNNRGRGSNPGCGRGSYGRGRGGISKPSYSAWYIQTVLLGQVRLSPVWDE